MIIWKEFPSEWSIMIYFVEINLRKMILFNFVKKFIALSSARFYLRGCSLRLWLMGIICNFWEPIRQTYGSIMHTRAMQVKTCQCLNPRRRPSATIRIESACGVATDWVTCGFLNPVNGAWRLMYSRGVKIYRLVIAKRENEQPTLQRVRWKCN